MELHGYIKDQRLHISTKVTTLVAFVQELIALCIFCKIHFACFRQIISKFLTFVLVLSILG